jgi:hypothetical protein
LVVSGPFQFDHDLALDHTRKLKLLLSAPPVVLNDSAIVDQYVGWEINSNEGFVAMREKLRRHKYSMEVRKLRFGNNDADIAIWDLVGLSIMDSVSFQYLLRFNH